MRGPIVLLVAGPTLWMAYFGLAYLAVSFACAGVWPYWPAVSAMLLLTAATLAGEAWIIWAARRGEGEAVTRQAAAILALLALVATVWLGAGLLYTSCG